ncbi:MAG: class I SAM-dependent methyltransferase, partial [Acidobacteriota bacterium]
PGLAEDAAARVLEGLPDHVEVRDMRFSLDLFAMHVPVWRKLLAPLAGRAGLRFLEIGSFEGRSACWLLGEVLTHPDSQLTCIDTFDLQGQSAAVDRGDPLTLEARFEHNIASAGGAGRVEKRVGTSGSILPGLEPESLDFAYIDGSHHPRDVLADAVMTWRLLKTGAAVTFDDYGSISAGELMPRKAIDAFMDCYRGDYELVHKGYQLTLRKTGP